MGIISCTNTDVQLMGLPVNEQFEDFAGEDTAIEMPDAIAKFMVEEGADGGAAFYRTAKRGGDVTFRFLPTSRWVQILWNFWVEIEEARDIGAVKKLIVQGSLINNDTGAKCQLINGILREAPPFYTMERDKVSSPAFTFYFVNIKPDMTAFDTELSLIEPIGQAA